MVSYSANTTSRSTILMSTFGQSSGGQDFDFGANPREVSPLWSLLPLLIGTIGGFAAKEPILGITAGALGSAGTYGNIAAGNSREQQRAGLMAREARGNYGVEKYLGTPDDVMSDAMFAGPEMQKILAQHSNDVGAAGIGGNMMGQMGFANPYTGGGGGGYGGIGKAAQGNSAGYMPVPSEQFTSHMAALANSYAQNKMNNTTSVGAYNDLLDDGKLNGSSAGGGGTPFSVAQPSINNQILMGTPAMRSGNMQADIMQQLMPDIVNNSRTSLRTDAQYYPLEKAEAYTGKKQANQTVAIQNQALPSALAAATKGADLTNTSKAQDIAQTDKYSNTMNDLKVKGAQLDINSQEQAIQNARDVARGRLIMNEDGKSFTINPLWNDETQSVMTADEKKTYDKTRKERTKLDTLKLAPETRTRVDNIDQELSEIAAKQAALKDSISQNTGVTGGVENVNPNLARFSGNTQLTQAGALYHVLETRKGVLEQQRKQVLLEGTTKSMGGK